MLHKPQYIIHHIQYKLQTILQSKPLHVTYYDVTVIYLISISNGKHIVLQLIYMYQITGSNRNTVVVGMYFNCHFNLKNRYIV